MPRRTLVWAPIGVAAGVLVWHSLQYNFVTDDAYISFVYSRNFAEHGELAFNLGDPVEGYTNFLWTFVLGLLMLVGIPPEISSLVLGTGCGIATLAMTFVTMRRLGVGAPWAYLPAFLLAWSSGFACWSSGGLETQLFTLLVVLAIDGYIAGGRAYRRMGACLALAAMTRPEGLLVAGVIGLHRVAIKLAVERQWRPQRDELFALAAFLVVWAPWFAWRYWYYGYWAPNTYYVKATGEWRPPKLADLMISQGFYYVKVWLYQTRLVWALPLAAIGIGFARPLRGAPGTASPRFVAATLCALLGGVYLGYAISVGGDFMGLHRFIMPVFVLAALAIALGADRVDGWIVRRWPARPAWAPYAAGAILVAAFAWTQVQLTITSLRWGNFANDKGLIDTPSFLITYTEDRAAIGRAMAPCFRPDDFSIVGGAGAQPYFGRMRAIDLFGLVSDRIAHGEPRTNARAGHTKRGSDATLQSYHPTFVFSCYTLHASPDPPPMNQWIAPCSEAYWQRAGFEKATMFVPALRQFGDYYTFWVRKDRSFQCDGRVR
jgi:hypothetical protein